MTNVCIVHQGILHCTGQDRKHWKRGQAFMLAERISSTEPVAGRGVGTRCAAQHGTDQNKTGQNWARPTVLSQAAV
jgi:hypothetical protein